jgi:methenyltetrahydromethanopterin cyclohydrolase
VTFVPAVTGSGVSVFVTLRSAEPTPTVVTAVAELFAGTGSAVVDDSVAVFVMTVPELSDGSVCTTIVKKSAVTPKLAFEHVIVPVAPTAGVVHVHGPVVDSDTNVVPAGSVSVKLALAALLGPLFVSVSW